MPYILLIKQCKIHYCSRFVEMIQMYNDNNLKIIILLKFTCTV